MEQRPEEQFESALIDAELVDRRWRQRRLLRAVPDWMIRATLDTRGFRSRRTAISEQFDVDLMEIHLRDLADAQATKLGDATFVAFRAANTAVAVQHLYNRWNTDNLEPMIEAYKTAVEGSHGRDLDVAVRHPVDLDYLDGHALASLIMALTWADELAGDSYVDPRVPSDYHAAPEA